MTTNTFAVPQYAPAVELQQGIVGIDEAYIVADHENVLVMELFTDTTLAIAEEAVGTPNDLQSGERGLYVSLFKPNLDGEASWEAATIIGFPDPAEGLSWNVAVSRRGDTGFVLTFYRDPSV